MSTILLVDDEPAITDNPAPLLPRAPAGASSSGA
jgi:hypothetical protein